MISSDPWRALSPRVVMVSSFAERDGIGRYADQMIAAHSEGRSFVRVGIPEGPGDYHRPLHRGPRALWLLRDARRRDDVVLHYHPHYYVRGGLLSRIGCYASWGLLGLIRTLVVVAHEPDPTGGPGVEELVRRWAWRRARQVVFHSQWERDRWRGRYGATRRQDLAVVEHGAEFTTRVRASRVEARDQLGLPGDRVLLLMIGFLSSVDPDKGYDRAIAAVQAADDRALELRIVGSPIRQGRETERLVADLRSAAASSARIVLHEEHVGDDAFDLWIRAADAVLTPYRTSSSSSVLARAHLLGTRVITSDTGGLAEQAGPGDIVVRDDAELLAAVRRVAREATQAGPA